RAIIVTHFHQVAVSALTTGADHRACCDGPDLCAFGGGDVQTGVEGPLLADRVLAPAEVGADLAVHGIEAGARPSTFLDTGAGTVVGGADVGPGRGGASAQLRRWPERGRRHELAGGVLVGGDGPRRSTNANTSAQRGEL